MILYEGPSMLDGAPIVAIATMGTRNRKTGPMLQTWIMRADVAPTDARKSGEDASVCGDCPHRDGTCYVTLWQAPLAVWRAYRRGSYKPADPRAVGADRLVRIGSYGDPAAGPMNIWRALVSGAVGHTGYTHQWRIRPDLRDLVMASVDSPDERTEAAMKGWRTFRIRSAGEPLMRGEYRCPASKEAGARQTCASCQQCNGRPVGDARKGSPVIIVH